MTELLVPAGSLEVLKVAVLYGADAVYIGGEAFSLRAKAKNFTETEMAEGIAFAHEHGVKVYVTANIFAHNDDLSEAIAYFKTLNRLRPDAVIMSDPGMITLFFENCENIDLHISTQANNTNYLTWLFWRKQGAKRVVSARELSFKEIREIRKKIPDDMEIESFVHGAMCISYSGRCLLSNFLTGRDANRGECTHPCRWQYALMEETRPGVYFPVSENERGTYIFNSKDLCMIGHIPDVLEAGIDSLKIEGRMKTALYVATVTRAYRRAIDDLRKDPALYESHKPWYLEEVAKCTYRPFTTGFFYGKPGDDAQIYEQNGTEQPESSSYCRGYTYLGLIEKAEENRVFIEQKNKFTVGDKIELMKPDGQNIPVTVLSIQDEEGREQESAPHPRQKLMVTLGFPQEKQESASAYDILRVKEPA
ncbi:MAG: U32 family peptidase [Lachnospiraceae bacterium]|nr:U32 family peptidase [Lachnospiraceae bacterium]